MLVIVLTFLFLSTFLYVVLGGADYGIGILELLSSSKNRERTKKTAYRVIGPVWEANHVWLIIVLVILWIAFPAYFQLIVIYLHIPLSIALFGIIIRGIAFVFRHYDAVKDGSQLIYDRMFEWSSLFTPLFLGMSFGALIGGEIPGQSIEGYSFYQAFLAPWLNLFSLSVGLFFLGLCAFNSSVFIIGETSGSQKDHFIRKAKQVTVALFIIGLGVVTIAVVGNTHISPELGGKPYEVLALVLIGLSLFFLLWRNLGKGKKVRVRILGVALSLTILGGLIFLLFPNIIGTNKGRVNILAGLAPYGVIRNLAISLLIGGAFIIPGLLHLLRTFGMVKILEKD